MSPFVFFHWLLSRRLLHLSLFFILLLFIAGGCGFFSTRDPDPPTGNQSGGDLALTPQDVLELMSSSFVLRDPNLYLGVISNDFEYMALPSAYPEDPTFFQGWSFDREANFIQTLLAITLLPPDSLSQLSFEQINEQQWADSSLFQERYTLEVHTIQQDLPILYTGLVRLTLVREEDGGWRIHRWEDEAISGETFTMSQLRAAL